MKMKNQIMLITYAKALGKDYYLITQVTELICLKKVRNINLRRLMNPKKKCLVKAQTSRKFTIPKLTIIRLFIRSTQRIIRRWAITLTHIFWRVQFFARGIPQVYCVGALAGKNDIELLEKTKEGRNINRHYYSVEEIAAEVKRPVVDNQTHER